MEFNEFFSQNANEKKTLTDFQIEEGFGYLGSTPPSRMDFDYMFRRADNNLYLVYNKYLAKASLKDSLDAVKLAYQKLDSDYQRVAGTRQKIYDAETFYYTDYPTYQQQNATNTQNTGNYTTDIQNMTSAIQTVSQEILDLVNRSYNNDISALDGVPIKEAQLQSLIDQLNNLSPSDSDLPGYLSKNKQVNVGDVFNVVGVPAMYKAFCSSAGTTGNNKLEIASENVEDGYTFTYGTASFILFASFLSIPVSGSVDILAGGNFRVSQDGHLINPLTGSVMQHRKLMFFDKIQEESEYAQSQTNNYLYNANKNYILKNGLEVYKQVNSYDVEKKNFDRVFKGSYSDYGYENIGFASVNFNHTDYGSGFSYIMPKHSHEVSFTTDSNTDGTTHSHNWYTYNVSTGTNTLAHNYNNYLSFGDTPSGDTLTITTSGANQEHSHDLSVDTDNAYTGSTYDLKDIPFLSPNEFPESIGLFFVVYA